MDDVYKHLSRDTTLHLSFEMNPLLYLLMDEKFEVNVDMNDGILLIKYYKLSKRNFNLYTQITKYFPTGLAVKLIKNKAFDNFHSQIQVNCDIVFSFCT